MPLLRSLREAAHPRVSPLDALELATRTWLKGERIDLSRLAQELGVGRTTLFRWVGTREELYGEVLRKVYARQRKYLLDTAKGSGLELLENIVRRNLQSLATSAPLRTFIEHDPEFAIRVLTSPSLASQQHSVEVEVALLRRVVAEAKLKPRLDLHTLAHIIVRIGEAVLYGGTIGGYKPDIDQAVTAILILVSAEQPGEARRRDESGRALALAPGRTRRGKLVGARTCCSNPARCSLVESGED
jgi:AcrR family transcriptional regulator